MFQAVDWGWEARAFEEGEHVPSNLHVCEKRGHDLRIVEFSVGGTGRIRPMHLERPAYEGMQED